MCHYFLLTLVIPAGWRAMHPAHNAIATATPGRDNFYHFPNSPCLVRTICTLPARTNAAAQPSYPAVTPGVTAGTPSLRAGSWWTGRIGQQALGVRQAQLL